MSARSQGGRVPGSWSNDWVTQNSFPSRYLRKVVQLPELEIRPVTSDIGQELDVLACEPSKPATASLPAMAPDVQAIGVDPPLDAEHRLAHDTSLLSIGDASMSVHGSHKGRGKTWAGGKSYQLPPVRRCMPLTPLTSVLKSRPSMPYSLK